MLIDFLIARAFEFDAKPDHLSEISPDCQGDPIAALVDDDEQAVIFQRRALRAAE